MAEPRQKNLGWRPSKTKPNWRQILRQFKPDFSMLAIRRTGTLPTACFELRLATTPLLFG
jgi:hypothetical protein